MIRFDVEYTPDEKVWEAAFAAGMQDDCDEPLSYVDSATLTEVIERPNLTRAKDTAAKILDGRKDFFGAPRINRMEWDESNEEFVRTGFVEIASTKDYCGLTEVNFDERRDDR